MPLEILKEYHSLQKELTDGNFSDEEMVTKRNRLLEISREYGMNDEIDLEEK